jgi:hypothetical protein
MTSILCIPNYKFGYQYNTNVILKQQIQMSSINDIIFKSDLYKNNNHNNGKILALSAINKNYTSSLTKRSYMSDYKPFHEFYGYKNIGTQCGKGIILTFSMLLLEFNLHLDEIVRATAEDRDEPEPFDWELKANKYIPIFKASSLRFLGTSLFKSVFELISYRSFNDRLVDSLTKDLQKSIERKCIKCSSRIVASKKIFKTALLSNSIVILSTFAYDAVQGKFLYFIIIIINFMIYYYIGIYNTIVNKDYSSCKAKNIVIWTLKKSIFFISLDLLYSAGFSFGSFFNIQYGGLLGSVIFELIGSQALTSILEI